MDHIDYSSSGVIFDIQRFSIHDGPGIRTIVFMKGCPLSCLWCSNPESQQLKPTIMFRADYCIHCGRCLTSCPSGALSVNNEKLVDRAKCAGCGECANVCPTGALVLKGKTVTAAQTVKELKKDAITFRRSRGGITFSGGEPLVQHGFLLETLKACKEQGWHTAMETTGYAPREVVEKIFPWVDLALFDIKSMDAGVHKKHTGVTNELILENSRIISNICKTVVRVPAVPDVNATEAALRAVCEHVRSMNGVDTIHILPYHTYGENKYELMGREYAMKGYRSLTGEEIENFRKTVEGEGFRCVIGG